MHIKYKSSRDDDHEAIPQMKRDPCMRAFALQHRSLVNRH